MHFTNNIDIQDIFQESQYKFVMIIIQKLSVMKVYNTCIYKFIYKN